MDYTGVVQRTREAGIQLDFFLYWRQRAIIRGKSIHVSGMLADMVRSENYLDTSTPLDYAGANFPLPYTLVPVESVDRSTVKVHARVVSAARRLCEQCR